MEVLTAYYAEPFYLLSTQIDDEHNLINNYKNGIKELGMHNK